jgi:hypothetical protein
VPKPAAPTATRQPNTVPPNDARRDYRRSRAACRTKSERARTRADAWPRLRSNQTAITERRKVLLR